MKAPAEMASAVKELALRLGFDVVGISSPAIFEEGGRDIDAWVGEGRHGSMKYMENFSSRLKRFLEEFGEVKSIVVLGVNYYTRDASPSAPAGALPAGRIARYAWGQDYHHVLRKKHEEFIALLHEVAGPGLKARSCIDTQPVPERRAAVRAGFGFLGRHTNLLSRRFGPWLFLSEIVLNIELDPDLPAAGDCGTCTQCKQTCPTGALNRDYEMDARLCIAYLTIEHKGVIERSLRPFIKDWVFGCDECLNVCPFTAHSRQSAWPEFQAGRGAGPWLDLAELFEISSNVQYEKRFEGMPLLRANRKQMMRNACLVLGNSGREEAIPYLERALRDPAPLVRLHAAWGLGQFSAEAVRKILLQQQSREKDPSVLEEIDFALSRLP